MGEYKKTALILAYHLPPLGGIPVMRALRLIKYLPDFGWRVKVITCERGYDPVHAPDSSLLAKLPADLDCQRILDRVGAIQRWIDDRSSSSVMYWLERFYKLGFFPDEKIFWSRRVFSQISGWRGAELPDVIFATGFPWSTLLLGYWLKKQWGVPLVVDLRDSWSLSPVPVWSKLKIHRRLEERIFSGADAIVFTTVNTMRAYQARYPDEAHKMHAVHNGFDPDDFRHLPERPSPDSHRGLRMIHAGSLLDNIPPKARSRSLLPVLDALKLLKERHPEYYGQLRLDVYGNPVPNTEAYAKNLGLQDAVYFHGHRQHHEILRELGRSDLALLIVRRSRDAEQMVPAKLYELIGAGIPVLALSPAFSEAAAIVRDYGLGYSVCYDDAPNEICELLHGLSQRRGNLPSARLREAQAAFCGDVLTGRFANIFAQVQNHTTAKRPADFLAR